MKLFGKGLRIGRISRWLSPANFAFCLRCGTTWFWVEEHITRYRAESGCFPLCEKCWAELMPKERLPYYERLWRIWQRTMTKAEWEELWIQLETAVILGK